MPVRNVLPKPVRSRTRRSWWPARIARRFTWPAQLGIGALTFAFIDPSEARPLGGELLRDVQGECVPIGHAVKPNIAMVTGSPVTPTRRKPAGAARRLSLSSSSAGLSTTSSARTRRDARTSGTSIWPAAINRDRGAGRGRPGASALPLSFASRCASSRTPAWIRRSSSSRRQEPDDHICEALEVFGREVMPEFKRRRRSERAEARGSWGRPSRPRSPASERCVTGRRPDPRRSGLRHHRRAGRTPSIAKLAGGEPPPRRDVSTDRPDRKRA